MNTLKKLAPHAAILIGNMYYVFWGIDRVNKAMNFIDNGYTKLLLLALIACCAVDVLAMLPVLLSKLGRTDNPAPVFVRLGILAVNALLAAVVLILLAVDLFNEDLMLFLNEFVKILILLLCVSGLLGALQVTAYNRAYVRYMNRRAAQRRPAPQPRPVQRPQNYGRQSGYDRPAVQRSSAPQRQDSYGRASAQGYSRLRSESYSRPRSESYARQDGYSRTASRTGAQRSSRYEARR